MPDRRFRDMSLTEDEVDAILSEYLYHGTYTELAYFEFRERLEARAKRLLPLWRQWGLRELRYAGWIDGHNHATNREESPF